MEWLYFFLSLLFANVLVQVSGLQLPVRRARIAKRAAGASVNSVSLSSGAANSSALGTVGNIRYTTTINVNSVDVLVAIDTGSTDLWVIPPGGIGPCNNTGIALSLRYGDGTYGVDGTIVIAPVQFGSYKIGKQTLLNANQSTISYVTDIGIYGLMGLGFNNPLLSPITEQIQGIYGSEQAWAAPFLANVFQSNTSQPNIVAIELQRTGDLEDTDGGTFSIGEVAQEFAQVLQAPHLDQYPKGWGRWTALMDGMRVNGKTVNMTSTMSQVPSGKVVALLDTGNPYLQLTDSMRTAIFSGVPNAVFDNSSDTWIVPCNTTTVAEFEFGGQWFPVHPLDLTNVQWFQDSAGRNLTYCDGSNVIVAPGTDFDISLGDAFLRDVYSVFDFGNPFASDNTGPTPYMQLLSTTNATTAVADAVKSRQSTLSQMGPEVSPSQYLSLRSTSSASGTSLDLSNSSGSSESAVDKYAPAVIGLLAANLLVGLILLVLAVLGCVRRGRSKSTAKPSYVAVRSKDEDHLDTAYVTPYSKR